MSEYQSKPRSGPAKAVAICGAGLLVGMGLCGVAGVSNSAAFGVTGAFVFVVSFLGFLISAFAWAAQLVINRISK